MEKYTNISVNDLKFYEGNDDEYYYTFPQKPFYGLVGCFVADRVPNWGLFAVIDYDKKAQTISAIHPRMRLVNNKIELGIDATSDEFKNELREFVKNYPIENKCAKYDIDAYGIWLEKINEKYLTTFREVPNNYLYKVVTFKKSIAHRSLAHLPKSLVNDLDIPDYYECSNVNEDCNNGVLSEKKSKLFGYISF